MATKSELDQLKREWLADPIWDIYESDGFEDHREELKAFQAEQEGKWEEQRKQRRREEMDKMGIGNKNTYSYLKWLEWRVEKMEKDVAKLEQKFYDLGLERFTI
jgi:hypothetical protein